MTGAGIPAINFPAYRNFDRARAEANDAMMALLIGSRLSAHMLAANVGSTVMLPYIYPAVEGVQRLNRTVADAQELLAASERHLTAMAIPYIQSTYENLCLESTHILRSSGLPAPSREEESDGLKGIHNFFERVTKMQFDSDLRSLADLTRMIRNQVIHADSAVGTRISGCWSALSPAARQRWTQLAKRPLNLSGPSLDLGQGELVATLAIYKGMARSLNDMLATRLSVGEWTRIAVTDFLENYPPPLPKHKPALRKKAQGWCRLNYGSLQLSLTDIESHLKSQGLL